MAGNGACREPILSVLGSAPGGFSILPYGAGSQLLPCLLWRLREMYSSRSTLSISPFIILLGTGLSS